LAATGEYRRAEKILRGLLYELAAGDSRSSVKPDSILGREAGLRLAEILLAAGRPTEAEQQCLAMLGGGRDQEVMVLLAKCYVLDDRQEAADKVFRQLLAAETDPIRLLRLAELYQQNGFEARQVQAAGMALEKVPGSLRAGLLQVEGMMKQGVLSTALKQALGLTEKFPDCTSVNVLLAQLYYLSGSYQPAVRQADLVLEKEPGRLDMGLLKLRCALARNDHAAVEKLLRETFPLSPDRVFLNEVSMSGLPVPANRDRKNLWQRLTFNDAGGSFLGETLDPESLPATTDKQERSLQLLATGLLARYRWEKKFRAVMLDD